MRPRLSPIGLALFAGLLAASCSAGHGGHRSADAVERCDDTMFRASMYPCGLIDRDGFDGSDRRHDRDRPDRDKPDRDPPPFAGKDT